MQSVQSYLEQNRRRIQACLGEFLPRQHAHPDLHAFRAMMWDYPSRGGKGVRSSICLATCAAFGGDPEDAIRTAAALELFQNWILIHDDVEDDSDLRRGEPCLHRKHGVPLAINVGDALHNQMWRLLHSNTSKLGYTRTFSVLQEFNGLVDAVAAGQHIELTWVEEHRWMLTEEDYYAMCERKTASYTCVSPCRLGALLAGASDTDLKHLSEMGRMLGLAFQLQDDVLNLVGDESKYGKEIAGDLWEGKRTLILIHLLRHATNSERLQIQTILNKPRRKKQPSEIEWILDRMQSYGSIAYAQQEATDLASRARLYFERYFPELADPISRDMLLRLMNFLAQRDH